MKTTIAAVLLVAIAGCSRATHDWEAARAGYCDEVELLHHEVTGAIAIWAKRFDQIAAMPAGEQRMAFCQDARGNLERLSAKLSGFTRGASVLALGRGADPVDKAGLALELGALPLMRMLVDIPCVDADPPYQAYPKRVRDGGDEAVKQLDDALESCRRIGWKARSS